MSVTRCRRGAKAGAVVLLVTASLLGPAPGAVAQKSASEARPTAKGKPPVTDGTTPEKPITAPDTAAPAPPGPAAALPPAEAAPPAAPPTAPAVEVTTPADDTVNVIVPASPRREEPAANNWAVGVLGLALLAAAVYFGLRYARQRGFTVPDALRRLGVEMPQDGTAGAPVPHLKPAAPPLPPLPSLADLPDAGAAPGVPVAPPTASSGVPRLVGLEGPVAGEAFELSGPLTVGREEDNNLALTQDNTLSRRHARIAVEGGAWVVTDEGSSNGTYVNGQRVTGTQRLQPGDVLQVGASRLRFEA